MFRNLKKDTVAGCLIWLIIGGGCVVLAYLIINFKDWIFPW